MPHGWPREGNTLAALSQGDVTQPPIKEDLGTPQVQASPSFWLSHTMAINVSVGCSSTVKAPCTTIVPSLQGCARTSTLVQDLAKHCDPTGGTRIISTAYQPSNHTGLSLPDLLCHARFGTVAMCTSWSCLADTMGFPYSPIFTFRPDSEGPGVPLI